MDDTELMRLAFAEAMAGISAGQTPFGACIALEGRAVVCSHNQVWKDTDITAHAEIVAIREACRKLGMVDLSGCVMYATTEPCPMCFSACHWARISTVVYGSFIADAKSVGFNELTVSDEDLKRLGGSPINIRGGFLRDEAIEVLNAWNLRQDRRSY